MADPLSITLTVVTLATALKDLVELAQKINESFKKPARNVHAAKALAEETLEIITGLKDFYDGHQGKLDSSPEMRNAVIKLLRDMNRVYNRCRPVLQVYDTSNRRLHTIIKHKFDAWRKRDDLEEYIRNVRDLANKCHRQFTTFSLVRIEAATAQIAQIQATAVEIQTTTVQIRSVVTDGFARACGRMSSLRVSDENSLAFLGSAPVILSTLPSHVQLSERLVYRSYITLQVGKIEELFKALASRGSYPVEEPNSEHLASFRTVVYLIPSTNEKIEDVQSIVFALIVKIQESLQSRDNRPSIQRGAYAMLALAGWISNLGMDQESLTIVQLAVDLYRTLHKTNVDVYGPHLAHALLVMSSCYVHIGNVVEAYKVITEAVTLGRRLADENPTFEAKLHLADLVSHSAFVGRCNGDRTNALKDAEEAMQSYQCLIGNLKPMLRMEVRVAEGLRMSLEGTHVYRYAHALKGLHYSLLWNMRHDDSSIKAGVEALEIYSGLEQRQSNLVFIDKIASLCSSLASTEFREMVPVDQALLYARGSVQQYEKMLQITGVVPDNLPNALGLEVNLLSILNKFDEAYEVCQKLEHMIQIQIDSQQLRAQSLLQLIVNLSKSKHHSEAALTGEQLLSRYQSLLSDEELLRAYWNTSVAFGRISEWTRSFQVAEASVNHWRMLAVRNTKYLTYAARTILFLTRQYFVAKDHERAYKEGGEALRLFSSLITGDSSVLKEYMDALELNIKITKEAKTELESLERSQLVVQYSRALVNQFPDQQLFLVRRIRDHAVLLYKFDHLSDASVAISDALDWFDAHPAQDSESAELHINCLVDFSRFLLFQGHPDRVPSLHDKAIVIGQHFMKAYPVAQNILWARALNLQALYLMGQISIALDEIGVSFNFALEHNLETCFSYFLCLEVASRIYQCSGKIDSGLLIMRRSLTLSRQYSRVLSSWILSDLLADAGQEAEAIDAAQEAVQEWVKWKNSSDILDKECHIQALYSLSLRLFASGELTQAQELLVQVRSFYEQHTKKRKLWFINLATTLWAMGHLECASGRHEQGIASRTELNELRKRLQLVLPSLADLMEVGLNREKNFASWKKILEKYNLSCGHQDEEEMPQRDED